MHLLCHLGLGRPPNTTPGDLILYPEPCAPRGARVPSRLHTSSAAQTERYRMLADWNRPSPLLALFAQIKTHRKHREEPGNLMVLIISIPQAPCGTQDISLPFRLAVFLRGVRKKKKAKLHFQRAKGRENASPGLGSAFHRRAPLCARRGAPPAAAVVESWRHLAS